VADVSSLLESEIAEQGAVLSARAPEGMAAAGLAAELLRGCGHVVVAARGSSDNAARFAQYLFGDQLRLQVGLAAPWLYRDVDRAPLLRHAAVMAISQSGRSPDIVAVLAAARRQGCPTIVITNAPGSELAADADVVVPLLAGEERSVAATKSYLASLHAVVQIVERLSPSSVRLKWLERLPDEVTAMAGSALARRAEFDELAGCTPLTATGRGLFFSTACETALKLRELSGIPAEAFSPPDLMHGPIAALHPPAGTWLIDPSGDELGAVMKRVTPGVIVSADQRALALARVPVTLPPGLPDWVASILAVLPGQAAGLRLAERTGSDVDNPHGLRKVTMTS
jgi:glucosamine--fructose-6-phosphate aminotransferase (isomerizing)